MDLIVSSADGDTDQAGTPITLSLLALINQARNEHGMRQQDYKRYRQFCSAKVHRVRETLNKTHTAANTRTSGGGSEGASRKANNKKKNLSKNAKRKAQSATVQSEQSKGKGNVFVRKQINVKTDVQNDRPAQLFLFEAERAWAYSQELKQSAFDNEQDGKLRRHGLARARRAVQWSQQLLDLTDALGKARIDVISRAEAEAYHCLLRGYEAFDKEQHQQSLGLLSVARKVFNLIADASTDSRKEALANSFVDGTDAMLRFCAYNLDIAEQDMDKLAAAVATPNICQETIKGYEGLEKELQEKAGQANAVQSKDARLDEVEWRGKHIAIRNPDLVEVFTKARAAEEALRLSLKVKGETQKKEKINREHKRQRLTSAQRSAKRRGEAITVTTTGAVAESSAQASAGSKTEMDGYDSLLAALTEAEDVSQQLVQDNAEALAKSHSGRYEAAGSNLIDAHEYLLFKLLAARVERNFVLMDDLQVKSEKRRTRAREHTDERIKSLTSASRSRAQGDRSKEPIRRRVKPSPRKVRPVNVPRKSKKKPSKTSGNAFSMPGSKSAAKKQSPRTRLAQERLHQRGELKMRRIAARIIPGLARLLDANEMSCGGMSGLNLIEADANLSTLIEAKSAWYKAELLRLLARSYAWSDESSKALVLLNRADLFVREARSAMELVEKDQVHEEDTLLLPPEMNEATFDKTTEQIHLFRLQTQRELFARQRGVVSGQASLKSISGAQSKAAQAVRDLASKYVEFDQTDLQQASVIPAELEEQFEAEVSAGHAVASSSRRPSAAVSGKTQVKQAQAPLDIKATSSSETVKEATTTDETDATNIEPDAVVNQTLDEGPYDPANMLAEEEEREAQEAAAASASQRGWFGGLFGGRK